VGGGEAAGAAVLVLGVIGTSKRVEQLFEPIGRQRQKTPPKPDLWTTQNLATRSG
jgi:hypothetical protein